MDERDDELAALLGAAAIEATPTPAGWDAIVARSARYSPERRRLYMVAIAAAALVIVLLTVAITARTPNAQDLYIGKPPATGSSGTSLPPDPEPSADPSGPLVVDAGPPTTETPTTRPPPADGAGRALLGAKTGLTIVIHDGSTTFEAIDLDTSVARRLPGLFGPGGATAGRPKGDGFAITSDGQIAQLVTGASSRVGGWHLLPLDLASGPLLDAFAPPSLAPGGYGAVWRLVLSSNGACPSYASYATGAGVTTTIGPDAAGVCNRLLVRPAPGSTDGSAGRDAKEIQIRDLAGPSPTLILVSYDGRRALVGDATSHTQVVDLETGTVLDTGIEPLSRPGIYREAQWFWSPDSRYVFEYRRTSTPTQHAELLAGGTVRTGDPEPYTDAFGTPIDPAPAQLIMLDTLTGRWGAATLPLAHTSLFATALVSSTGPVVDAVGATDCPAGPTMPAGTATVTLTETACLLPAP